MQLKLFILPVKNLCAAIGLALSFLVATPAWAASQSADSNVTTVDTRNNLLTVAGHVLDAASRSPLSGAAVTLAGQSTSSSASGQFSFGSVSLSSGYTLAVSKSGYATYTGTVPAPAGATAVTLPDIVLHVAPVGGRPVVTSVRPKYDGIFLSGAAIFNDYTATVDWAGHPPGSVEFRVNGTLRDTVATTTTEATATINMGLGFYGSLTLGANKVTTIAVSGDGVSSDPFEQAVGVIQPPDFLIQATLLLPLQLIPGNAPGYLFEVQIPPDAFPASALLPIPYLDKIGLGLAGFAELKYDILSGQWALRRGVKLDSPKWSWGGWRADLYAAYTSEGVASQTRGFGEDYAGITLRLDARHPILVVYVLDVVPGAQVLHVLDVLTLVGVDINSIQRFTVNGLLRLQGDFLWNLRERRYQQTEFLIRPGLEALYAPNLLVASLEISLSGHVGIPLTLSESFRVGPLTGLALFGLEAKCLLFKWEFKYVLFDGPLPFQGGKIAPKRERIRLASPLNDRPELEWFAVPVKTSGSGLLNRDYLASGSERLAASDSIAGAAPSAQMKGSSALAAGMSPLEAFRAIGKEAVATTRLKSGDKLSARSQIKQADLPVLENVFPSSQPALAGRGQELMLLYVTDNGASNALQFTDIKWTRFDGTNWSVPATIQTNTQAEFSPQVAYDGNGDAIAVWERVADVNFNQTNLTAMAAQMEIVWSKWNRVSGAWTVPVALTANGYLDHAPLLSGPLTDGSVLAVWTRNYANQLMGTGPVGGEENDRVMWARWSAASQTWSAPLALLSDLSYRLSQSLSAVSNRAVYAWTRDVDGVLTNAADQQVFYCAWSNGVWSAATQFTTNTDGNRNARVSVGPDGHSYLVWQSGTNLVLSRDFATNSTLVRADSETAGVADYAMTIGPAGNLALLWQEMSQAGSDAHYRVLDPASATWSKDAQLFNDPPLERSFAPVWDDVGNLTVAYNKVEIIYTNKTVTLEGGGTVTITNVPQPGRVDLYVTKRQLIKDVALAAGDFTVSAENYLPGAALTLSATLRNAGDLAVSNAVVAFYDGNPAAGGVLITNLTVSGWLEGAAANPVSTLWVVPEPATNHVLFAVADPAGELTEFDEANNTQSLSIGGTDLAVSLISQSAEANGAVRVIAQVQNLGAPFAPNSVLAIRRFGEPNAPPLAAIEVPSLEPGRLAQMALDVPTGTVPEGESIFTLTADDSRATLDVERSNNSTSFAVNLWIDGDGDGMPDQYERDAGLSPNDPTDAALDRDQDGLTELAEYRAGTDPRDPKSYLRIKRLEVGGELGGVLITWGSSPNRLYTILRAPDLTTGWTPTAEHILSTPPENSYLDTAAKNAPTYFYRVRVE